MEYKRIEFIYIHREQNAINRVLLYYRTVSVAQQRRKKNEE